MIFGKKNVKFKKGFTLAEVLITLGIVGLIAAMTLPGLKANFDKKSYVTALNKVYSELSQALTMYKTDNNSVDLKEAGFNDTEALKTFVKTYFNVTQKCETNAVPCMAEKYTKMNRTASWEGKGSKNCYQLAEGATICPRKEDDGHIWFLVDVNGQKKPNILGRDLFVMYVYDNGVIDDKLASLTNYADNLPLSKTTREALYKEGCLQAGAKNLHGCFGKILNDNWQMTY